MINFYLITIDADVGGGERERLVLVSMLVLESREMLVSRGMLILVSRGMLMLVSRGMLMLLVSREMVVVKREMVVVVRRKRKLTVMSGLQISLVLSHLIGMRSRMMP